MRDTRAVEGSVEDNPLHAELLELLEIEAAPPRGSDGLSAAAYRTREGAELRLEMWAEPLAVGAPLPTLRLWLDADLALPLDLERSYVALCRTLRIG